MGGCAVSFDCLGVDSSTEGMRWYSSVSWMMQQVLERRPKGKLHR